MVGTVQIQVAIPGCRSLKEKRRHIKGLLDRLRSRFGVGCAEVGQHDRWDRSDLGAACVTTTAAHACQIIQAVVSAVERTHSLVLIDYSVEIL